MKTLEELKSQIPDYAKDVKKNLENLLGKKNKLLTPKQAYGAALAAAYATKEKILIRVMENEAESFLSKVEINLARTAAVMMVMNNTYYCFTHMSDDKEYLEMPVNLVMGSIKGRKIDKIDFEISSLAVSVINSCSICIDSHESRLFSGGFSRAKIQAVAQIAAVMNATAQLLVIQEF